VEERDPGPDTAVLEGEVERVGSLGMGTKPDRGTAAAGDCTTLMVMLSILILLSLSLSLSGEAVISALCVCVPSILSLAACDNTSVPLSTAERDMSGYPRPGPSSIKGLVG
jgi:hypothetical protein